jgi:hypothetical protein
VRLRQVACLFSLTLLVSCGRFPAKGIDLPSTPILSGGAGWALVKSSYVRLKEKPTASSADLAAIRDGSLAEVKGREFDSSGSSLWYELNLEDLGKDGKSLVLRGWVAESDLDIFASKAQAERALAARSAVKQDD